VKGGVVTKSEGSSKRPRIVIVGGGFGGAYCAQALERRLRRDEAEVVLLDRQNYFIFYPLLVEAGTGSLEPRHAVVSIRSFLSRTRFIMGTVDRVDPTARRVHYTLPDGETTQEIDYDHLVLTPGSVTRPPEVPGLAEHGFEMKSLDDAVTMRDRAIRQLEQADVVDDPALKERLLHFVVVGANFTGVEVAGELHVFLRRATKRYSNLRSDDITVTVVELGDRILPALDPELADYAAEHLRRRGVRIELGRSVRRVEAGRAVLDDGRELATDTVYWCAGIAPSPLLANAGVPTDERGYVRCERDLRVEGIGEVWAIGDSAVNLDADGNAYPATAQLAVRQGQHVAKNIVAVLRDEETTPCDLTNLGAIAALGCRTGVAKVLGIKIAGFPAWFLFRTVYLLKMPGWARRIRVALDWTIDLIFPKDIVQLGLAGRRPRRPSPAAVAETHRSETTRRVAMSKASPRIQSPV
jgi:NADH dehydrogenase